MELSFGKKPFAKKATPTPSCNVNTAPPPSVNPAKNAPPQPRHRKRQKVTINDSSKGENAKKSKTAPDEASSAAMVFGDLIKDNFRDKDITNWSNRGKVEAGFCFKQALGETFFHGIDHLNFLEGENSKLQSSLNSATISCDYYKGLLDGAEKKIEDMKTYYELDLKKIKGDADKEKAEAKVSSEA